MRQHGHAHKGVPLEDHVTATEQGLQLFHIERLQIPAHVQQRIALVSPECLDLAAHPKMIVPAVELARSRIARIIKNQALKAIGPFRMELAERLGKWALAYAGRPAQNHESPFPLEHKSSSLG